MKKYKIKLLTSSMSDEEYSVINDEEVVENHFTIQQFLDWFEDMKDHFDYSEDYFHFIPKDEGTEMFRKGNELTEVTKKEFNRALLIITMIQGD